LLGIVREKSRRRPREGRHGTGEAPGGGTDRLESIPLSPPSVDEGSFAVGPRPPEPGWPRGRPAGRASGGGRAASLRSLVRRPGPGVTIFVFAALFRAVLVGTPSSLSDDIHRYVWDGRVQAAGKNPYRS